MTITTAAAPVGAKKYAERGEGSIRQRRAKNGTLTYELQVRIGGRPRSFSAESKRECWRRVDAARASGVQVIANRTTVAGFAEVWLAEKRTATKLGTWRKYESVLRINIIPALGGLPLAALTTERLKEFYRDLRARLAPQSVNDLHRIVYALLEAAVEAKIIGENVARSRSLRQRVQASEKTILSGDEAQRLLRAAYGTPYEALFVLAITTGMRQGELLALRWRDIDLNAGTVKVTGTVTVGADKALTITSPKTPQARRTVLLTHVAIDALQRTAHTDPDLIFPASRGSFLWGSTLTAVYFQPLLAKAELP
nr:site-specific integrase [Candidatus Dormibacteraeota bacterium]